MHPKPPYQSLGRPRTALVFIFLAVAVWYFFGVKGSARFEGSDVSGLVGIELVKVF